MVWPYDPDCRLIGEHVYEDSTSREVVKPEADDVITPVDACRLLAPVLATEPV